MFNCYILLGDAMILVLNNFFISVNINRARSMEARRIKPIQHKNSGWLLGLTVFGKGGTLTSQLSL